MHGSAYHPAQSAGIATIACTLLILAPDAQAKDPLPGQPITPQLRLLDVMPVEQGPYDQTLALVLELTNTTERAMMIDGLTANITLNHARLGSGAGITPITIPPQHSRVFLMPARTDMAKLAIQMELLTQTSLDAGEDIPATPWTIHGEFYINGIEGPELYPYQFSGTLFAQ